MHLEGLEVKSILLIQTTILRIDPALVDLELDSTLRFFDFASDVIRRVGVSDRRFDVLACEDFLSFVKFLDPSAGITWIGEWPITFHTALMK